MKSNQPKAHCNLCHREIFDSVDSEKIITCAHCVLILMSISKEKKIEYKNLLLSKGLTEQARSVESFIADEVDIPIAIFKKTLHLRRSNPHLHMVKAHSKHFYTRN